jgi:hypothetical protein
MRTTYAVTWQDPDGAIHSGRLELGSDALSLEGRNGKGAASRTLRYQDVARFQLARPNGDRLQERPTLVLELADGSAFKIAGVAQAGIVSELAERLGHLSGQNPPVETGALIVPLRPGSRSRAEELLASGPPLDPAKFGLRRHEVFLTENEVIFVFEGHPGVFVDRLADQGTVWKAADTWLPLIDGPIRLGIQRYGWAS